MKQERWMNIQYNTDIFPIKSDKSVKHVTYCAMSIPLDETK